VTVINEGYSSMKNGLMFANATCSIIKSPKSIIIFDTLTAWDGPLIKSKLEEIGVHPDAVNYVISSHGHPDHTGNNNLFLHAKHIVGFCMHEKDQFELFPFEQGKEYIIDDWVKVVPTPGHTNEDVSLQILEKTELEGTTQTQTTIVSGDLFECEADIETPHLWMGNSFDPYIQATNRFKILKIANKIIPGHGPPFYVQPNHIIAAETLCKNFETEKRQMETKSDPIPSGGGGNG